MPCDECGRQEGAVRAQACSTCGPPKHRMTCPSCSSFLRPVEGQPGVFRCERKGCLYAAPSAGRTGATCTLCRFCGTPTMMSYYPARPGEQECSSCWEIRNRIGTASPEILRRIFADLPGRTLPASKVAVGIADTRQNGIFAAAFVHEKDAEAWCREIAKAQREHWGYAEGEYWWEFTKKNDGHFGVTYSPEDDNVRVVILELEKEVAS